MISQIRDRAPAFLIPSAWGLTFLTIQSNTITTYWIEHMHYFITGFLVLFAATSWKQMSSNPTLKIWRNIIALGSAATGIGAAAFFANAPETMLWVPVIYWSFAPGAGTYLSAANMDRYSAEYRRISFETGASGIAFIAGLTTANIYVTGIGLAGLAAGQTLSLLRAIRLDNS